VKKTLGEKVREQREKKGLTQEQLGDMVGLKQSTIGKIEKNTRGPSFKALMKLSKALDVTTDYLTKDDAQLIKPLKEGNAKLRRDYEDYYIAIDYAIENSFSPEDLQKAIKFLAAYKEEKHS
jgi:transcriptional regulator with XRE-family HTH domain